MVCRSANFCVLQCVAVRSCVLLFYNVLQWGAHFASKNLKKVLVCVVLQANRSVLQANRFVLQANRVVLQANRSMLHCAAPRILVFFVL